MSMSLLIKNWQTADWKELLKWAKIGANNAMIGEFSEVEEIPPHGRLIDADALKDVQQADADFFKGSSDYGEKCRYDEAINAVANIVNAPTIIPAEEGET